MPLEEGISISDEFFKAKALAEHVALIEGLEAKKKTLNAALLLDNAVMEWLQSKGNLVPPQNAATFTVAEVKLLLKWKKIKPASSKKVDLVAAYYTNPPPLPNAALWTPDNELELETLKSDKVNLINTALGIRTAQMSCAVRQNMSTLDPTEKAELLSALMEDDAIDPSNVI